MGDYCGPEMGCFAKQRDGRLWEPPTLTYSQFLIELDYIVMAHA
jgi:hypothetical protein